MNSKLLHHSQVIEKELEEGSIEVNIKVKVNFELERLILGFGDTIKVLQPERLKKRISQKLEKAKGQYGED